MKINRLIWKQFEPKRKEIKYWNFICGQISLLCHQFSSVLDYHKCLRRTWIWSTCYLVHISISRNQIQKKKNEKQNVQKSALSIAISYSLSITQFAWLFIPSAEKIYFLFLNFYWMRLAAHFFHCIRSIDWKQTKYSNGSSLLICT